MNVDPSVSSGWVSTSSLLSQTSTTTRAQGDSMLLPQAQQHDTYERSSWEGSPNCLCIVCHLKGTIFPRRPDGRIVLPAPWVLASNLGRERGAMWGNEPEVARCDKYPVQRRVSEGASAQNVDTDVPHLSGVPPCNALPSVPAYLNKARVDPGPTPWTTSTGGSASASKPSPFDQWHPPRNDFQSSSCQTRRRSCKPAHSQPNLTSQNLQNVLAVPVHLTSAPTSSSFTWRSDEGQIRFQVHCPATPAVTPVPQAGQVEIKWVAERKKRRGYFSQDLESSDFLRLQSVIDFS